MRKVSFWLLAGCLAVAFAACSDDSESKDKDTGPETDTKPTVYLDGGPAEDVDQTDDQKVDEEAPEPDLPVNTGCAAVVGKECTADADCAAGGASAMCAAFFTDMPGFCTCECTPDDPDTALADEDTCAKLDSSHACVTLPEDNFGVADLSVCMQTCQPTVGSNSCDGSLSCDVFFSAYYLYIQPGYQNIPENHAVCSIPGCAADADCQVVGVECSVNAQDCAEGECLPVGENTDEGRCVLPGKCDTASGLCLAHDLGNENAQIGDPCQTDLDCAGSMTCLTEDEYEDGTVFARNGYCTQRYCPWGGAVSEYACPTGSACNSMYISGLCQKTCDPTDEDSCRGRADIDQFGDYECRPDVFTQNPPYAGLCDLGAFIPCDSFESYGYTCAMLFAADQTNSTNMGCRDMENNVLSDMDPNGYCLDDTASGEVGGTTPDPDAGPAPDMEIADDAGTPDAEAVDAGVTPDV